MDDPPLEPDSDGDADDAAERGSTPRWVKVFALVALVLVLLLVVLLLTGRGNHSPGRHAAGGQTPPSSVAEDHRPSAGDLGGRAAPAGGNAPQRP
jgi:hypothetical protein